MYSKESGAPWKGVEDSSHPVRSADVDRIFFPGVRKKRVPLAYPLAPLCGASCRQGFRAFADRLLFDPKQMQCFQQKIGRRSCPDNMSPAHMPPTRAANEHIWHGFMAMKISIGHVAGPEDQNVIEQCSVTVRSGL